MRNRSVQAVLLALFLGATRAGAAEIDRTAHGELQRLVDRATQKTLERFSAQKLGSNQLSITVIDLSRSNAPVRASFRGDASVYPASVVKLFYLVATHEWLAQGKLQDTPELRRALRDMIVESYNEATHYIVDLLTATTSGPELSKEELEQWVYKRDAVNRYFSAAGYTNINANKKPWCEGPYGREVQAIKSYQPSRNALTTDSTARLLADIVLGGAVSRSRSAEMMKLLERDPFSAGGEPDDQARGFSGGAVPRTGRLWSKAGWTSETRHDAAYIEIENGVRFVIVVFTTGHSNERALIPFVVSQFVENLRPE